MKEINKYIPFGIILIIFGTILFFLSGIDQFIRPFSQPILMGSSKGKDILFFVLFGITIMLSTLGDNDKIYGYIKNLSISEKLKNKEGVLQFLRFCIIGVLAAAVHYGVYFILQWWIDLNIAYTAGYLISFVGNFILTNYFTFRTKPTWKNFVGFAGSHGINYFLHIIDYRRLRSSWPAWLPL